jgi:hypothetical protein
MKRLLVLSLLLLFALAINSCNENTTETQEPTIEEYLQQVINNGYSSGNDEDNVMMREITDMDDGGAVPPNGGGNDLIPPVDSIRIDSLSRWGRKITNVTTDISITAPNDTIRNVAVTRNITGVYIIIGYVGGTLDSINKPYTMELKRNLEFRKVAHTIYPRFNWRLYQISNLDGETKTPQVGSTHVRLDTIKVYRSSSPSVPAYTFIGPNFNDRYFTTIWFNGTGIPSFSKNETITVKVSTTSQSGITDIVAFHRARNTFGFHRIPFTLEYQSGNYSVYTRTITLINHPLGVFNTYINASTRESLYDAEPNLFAVDEIGVSYKVLQ